MRDKLTSRSRLTYDDEDDERGKRIALFIDGGGSVHLFLPSSNVSLLPTWKREWRKDSFSSRTILLC